MVEGEGGHGADSHGGSRPPASSWPLVTAAAGLVLGIVLLWWWSDEDSNLTAPVLGATIVIALIALGAWIFENIGQGRRQSRYGDAGDARKTQVITFGIAEGKYEDAESGVLATLKDAHEQLRVQEGFEDLRVIASRSDSGVSQAIVETTWSNDNDLAAFESTRGTILDLVNENPDEVVTGSVQAFDMDVVHDTKDIFVRMGFGAATTIMTAVLLGGIVIGAVIGMTTEEVVASGGGDEPAGPTTSIQVIGSDFQFDLGTITAVADETFTVTFINDGPSFHNIKFLTAEGGAVLDGEAAQTAATVESGDEETISFTAPAEGDYFFFCSLHPDQMTGTFRTAPAPAAAPAAEPAEEG